MTTGKMESMRSGLVSCVQGIGLVSVLNISEGKEKCVIYQDKNTVSQKMCHVAKRIQRMGFLS